MKKAMLLTQLAPLAAEREARLADSLVSLAAPGAASVNYYRSVEGPREYALIETFASIEQVPPSHAALTSSGLGFARHVCAEVAEDAKSHAAAPFMMIVAFCVPQERRKEVDDWYEQEHAPLLMKAEGWLRARRHHCVESQGNATWTHIALHDLRDLETLDSKERTFARSTPWRARLTTEAWFGQAGRWVYERLELADLQDLGAGHFRNETKS